ncbi:replicative DNA helicase [Rhizobium leguminosarum bv. trifolii WSM2297]|uniref:Replicative DNA helicase n=1 Tax=Rhizobium leguminosarum bv. trifolii WSM2297 TaxID=754762 RepID=J0CAC7_RHILT|nr:DNA helicase [Rhizobium leguminosarum]EJC80052.1 replicative DNA helicase [Rhizobium leguminosarum bv. trifolii WSM2297]
MKMSAPIYHLKRKAKTLSRTEKIPLNQALDRIARDEGYGSWSLLAAKASAEPPAGKLFARLLPGDLLLVGARPGHGKTLMGLELAVEAMKSGSPGVFFSLEYTEKDVHDRFRAIGVEQTQFDHLFEFDGSDAISASYITGRLASAPRGTLVVIDYLQLLDQKRENPELSAQIRTLKAFAHDRGLIMVFISQIDRSFEQSQKLLPDIADIRLPNPLDLTLFDKTCFLNDGKVAFGAVG